jgi:hypothetical protein
LIYLEVQLLDAEFLAWEVAWEGLKFENGNSCVIKSPA